MGDLTRDDWLRALGDSIAGECDPAAKTINELALMFGVARTQMERRLRQMVVAGEAVQTWKRVHYPSSGQSRRQVAYRLIEKRKGRKR